MFKRVKAVSENMYEKVIDKALSREALSGIVISAGVTLGATAYSLSSVAIDANKAVKLSMGNAKIAQELYMKTNNSVIDSVVHHLTSLGIKATTDAVFDSNKSVSENVSEHYIKHSAKEYRQNLEEKYDSLTKVNYKEFANQIYKTTLELYGKDNLEMTAILLTDIGEKRLQETFINSINTPDSPFYYKADNSPSYEVKQDKLLSFEEFSKKITSTKDTKEIIDKYAKYLKEASDKKDMKVDKKETPEYQNTNQIQR